MPQFLADFIAWYRHSGLADAMLSIPLVETSILFVILTLCLLFRYSRTGILAAYLFVYRWGWSFYGTLAFDDQRLRSWFVGGYIICGVLVFTFGLIGMLFARRRED